MKNWFGSMLLILFLSLAVGAMAQEMLVGGNMEDASAWHVNHLDSQDFVEYEFNYTADTPVAGSGGCLDAFCSVIQATNILFWQEVTLIGGETYEVSGAFKDMTGGTLENFWCEVLLSTEAPPDTAGDYNGGTPLVAFNTWDGCGSGVDGTFQDDYCKGNGPTFVCPAAAGESATYYFSINIGVWAGGEQIDFEVLVDEMSLMHVGGDGVSTDHVGSAIRFALYPNYPNPFNPETQIHYTLQKASDVTVGIYDMLGRQVAILVDQFQSAGEYQLRWNGRDQLGNPLVSGVYFCHMQAGEFTQTQKMILEK